MFVERLKDEEILGYIKQQIQKSLPNTEVFYMTCDEFDYLTKKNKLLKEIYSKRKGTDFIYLLAINFFERKTDKNYGEYVLLELKICVLGREKTKSTEKKRFRKRIYNSRYNISDFHFSFQLNEKLKYFKFMYKNFGEEYLTALKKHFKEEKQSLVNFMENGHKYILKELTK